MALSMNGLRGGDATPNRRMTANNLYAVVAGTGITQCGRRALRVAAGQRDRRPGLAAHTHVAVEDAVMFRVSDEPVMSRLGFLRAAD